jgi:hypothetical protein
MNNVKQFMSSITITLSIIVLVGLASYKTFLNQERLAHFRERKHVVDSSLALGQEVSRSISLAVRCKGMSVENFTAMFGEITPDDSQNSKKPTEIRYVYYHPESQRTFHLQFEDGTLRGCNSSQGADDIDTSSIIIPSPAYQLSDSIRSLVLLISLVSWIVILIVMLVKPEQRARLANSLLILACMCVICWFLSGAYSQTLRGILSNDALAYGAFMLILSLGFQGVKVDINKQNPNKILQQTAAND